MDNKYFTIFDLMKDELDLDDKECTRVSGDPELAKWYSVIGLLNMSANELGEGEPSGEELESKLNDALTERYRDTDEMKKELDNALEILRKTIADNTIILGRYTSNYQIAIRALTDSNEAKDKIIEDRDETIRRLRREKVEKVMSHTPEDGKHTLTGRGESSLTEMSETPGAPETPADADTPESSDTSDHAESKVKAALKSFMRGRGSASAREKDNAPNGETDNAPDRGTIGNVTDKDLGKEVSVRGTSDKGTSLRATSRKENDKDTSVREADKAEETLSSSADLSAFIDQYVNNDEYSDEARSYLLDCYQSGTPLEVIRQFARPQFSVKILKRLKKIYERRRV